MFKDNQDVESCWNHLTSNLCKAVNKYIILSKLTLKSSLEIEFLSQILADKGVNNVLKQKLLFLEKQIKKQPRDYDYHLVLFQIEQINAIKEKFFGIG